MYHNEIKGSFMYVTSYRKMINRIVYVFTDDIKVAGQNPEVSTGIEIETRQTPLKPVETCHRNPSKPIETHRNLSKSKALTFAKIGLRFCPATLDDI